MSRYLFTPPPTPSLPIRGLDERFPVYRLFFVGRNYQAHAAEMGLSVDKSVDPAFYFTKSPHALVQSGSLVPYPLRTENYHHEMELVVVLGQSGSHVSEAQAGDLIYGYAAGLDMTRRDLQQAARQQGRPWDVSKDVEQGAVCSDIVPMPGVVLERGAIELAVNGVTRQSSDLKHMIWNIREIIADLSTYYHLQPGDLIYTGTPEGVGPVVPGDVLHGRVEGVAEVSLTLGPTQR
jgi:fumarylpyruvate hydrolase